MLSDPAGTLERDELQPARRQSGLAESDRIAALWHDRGRRCCRSPSGQSLWVYACPSSCKQRGCAMTPSLLTAHTDVFTEPSDVDPETLNNLGPLRRLAGRWRARKGVDLNPKAEGPERRVFIETIDFQAIDPQTNGPQLLYGLRYHIHITTEEEDITFHDQVGYWLWEPATGLILQTLAIPRGQVAIAAGRAAPDADEIVVTATHGQTE